MFRAVRLIIAAATLVAGCAPGGAVDPSTPKKTITKAQALARIEELVSGTAAAIRPEPRLEPYESSTGDMPCTDPRDTAAPAPVEVSRRYHLRDLPTTEDELREVVAAVKAYWQEQGHHISDEHRLNLHARSRPDDFLMSVQRGGGNVLTLGATSTCLWPDGTPPAAP